METLTPESMRAEADSYWQKKPAWRRILLRLSWKWDARPRPILAIKFAWQRSRRGFSNHDAWGFYGWHAEVVANLCDDYLKRNWSHPCGIAVNGEWHLIEKEGAHGKYWGCDCSCEDEWDRVLTVMRDGFRLIAKDEHEDEITFTIKPEVIAALDLFRKHYFSLWL